MVTILFIGRSLYEKSVGEKRECPGRGPGIPNSVISNTRLRLEFTRALGIVRLVEAEGVLDAMLGAQEFLPSDHRLTAVFTSPEQLNEWLSAHFFPSPCFGRHGGLGSDIYLIGFLVDLGRRSCSARLRPDTNRP